MAESDKTLSEKMAEKMTGGKKLRKDQCLIIVLVGILLCVIALPVGQKESKSDISNMINDTIDNHITTDAGEDNSGVPNTASSYTEYWENKLEDALREVEGVGKVKVLINLSQSEQMVVEKDGPEVYSETTEADAAGQPYGRGDKSGEEYGLYRGRQRAGYTVCGYDDSSGCRRRGSHCTGGRNAKCTRKYNRSNSGII